MRVLNTPIAFLVFLAALSQARAADTTEPGGPLDICLAAVQAEYPGVITAWKQGGGGPQPPYAITVLSKEGKTAETNCDASKPEKFVFKSKTGYYRFAMYERAIFPEDRARAASPAVFSGTPRILSMELQVSFAGKPQYNFQMILPSGHTALVEMDASVGRMMKAAVY